MEAYPYTLNITVYGNVTGRSTTEPKGTTKRWVSDVGIGGVELVDKESADIQYENYAGRNVGLYNREAVKMVEGNAHQNAELVGIGGHRIHQRDEPAYETTGTIDQFWDKKETTLHSQVHVLTFQLLDKYVSFCKNANTCPMSSVANDRFVKF